MFSNCKDALKRGAVIALLFYWGYLHSETFRVATWNVENYLDQATQTRHAKSEEAKAKIRECLLVLKPDVLALQEMGSVRALLELRDALKTNGLDFPHWEQVTG